MKIAIDKMKNLYLTGIIIFISAAASGQHNNLTRSAMLEDLDSLEAKIISYGSYIPLLEERTGSSVTAKIDELRKEVSRINTTFDFTNLIRRGLNILNDAHTGITDKSSVKWFTTRSYLRSVSDIMLSDTLYADYYHNCIMDSVLRLNRSGIRAKYVNGKYYNARPFTYEGKQIDKGEEIKFINRREINSFVNELYDQMFFLMWDPYLQQWYSDYFMLALPLLGYNTYTLTIGDREVTINSRQTMDNLEKERFALQAPPQVLTLSNDILYIYMPAMMNAGWYMNEIRKQYSDKTGKIIFDLRGNAGGDDSVWQKILASVLDQPLTYQYKVGMNYNPELERAVSSFGTVKTDPWKMFVDAQRVIPADENSLKFSGHIYILQDKYTFSAASAFISAARQNPQRFTILGERSACMAGYTFPPLLFKLNNSGIAFKLAFSYDATGKTENPYNDNVQIEIRENIKDYLDKIYTCDPHSKAYLETVDKYINYIRNIRPESERRR